MARVMGRAGLALGAAATVVLLLLVVVAFHRLRGASRQLAQLDPVGPGIRMGTVAGGIHVERP